MASTKKLNVSFTAEINLDEWTEAYGSLDEAVVAFHDYVRGRIENIGGGVTTAEIATWDTDL